MSSLSFYTQYENGKIFWELYWGEFIDGVELTYDIAEETFNLFREGVYEPRTRGQAIHLLYYWKRMAHEHTVVPNYFHRILKEQGDKL